MPLVVPGGSEWPAHRMPGHNGARETHLLSHMTKSPDQDHTGRYTGFLDRPGDVSDRHVTHRSDGYQQDRINCLVGQHLRPSGAGLLDDAHLSGGARERESCFVQRSDPSFGL